MSNKSDMRPGAEKDPRRQAIERAAGLIGLVAVQRIFGNGALRRGDEWLRRAEIGEPNPRRIPRAPSFLKGRVGRFFLKPYLVTRLAIDHFVYDDALSMASMLAFTLILALFPFLIFITAFTAMWGGEQLATVISGSLFEAFPEDIARALEPEVRNVLDAQSGGGLLTFGLAVMLFSLTGAIEAVRAGLNRAYGAIELKSILRTRFESLLFVLAGSIILVFVALLAVVAPIGFHMIVPNVPEILAYRTTFDLVRVTILALVLAVLLFALHRWLPAPAKRIRSFRDLWIGVVVTLVLWYWLGVGFSAYLGYFGGYTSTYAGLAGIVAALMFFYIASMVLLFGGEINRAVADMRREGWPGVD